MCLVGCVKSEQVTRGWKALLTYTAAVEAGICLSNKKKPTIRKMEMISGASTMAEPQPEVEAEVTAKMNKMRAAGNKNMVKQIGTVCRRSTLRTGQNRHAHQIKTPPAALRRTLIDFSLWAWYHKQAENANGYGNHGDKPEHP